MSAGSPTEKIYTPVSPLDVVGGPKRQRTVGFPTAGIQIDEKGPEVSTRSVRTSSSSSLDTANAPRKARFAEATSVNSPADDRPRPAFFGASKMSNTEANPSDVGFGYISDNQPIEQHATVRPDNTPGGAPLKSAMKTPGTSTRLINPMSATFREEQLLEREEEKTEKEQAKDLVSCPVLS